MVMPTDSTGTKHRRAQYARWAALLDSILPNTDETALVPVAEVEDTALPRVEESLAGVGVTATVSQRRTTSGEPRFQVLVPARDANAAGRAVAGY
jgi:hypothetical protein